MSLILDLIFGEKGKYTAFTCDTNNISCYCEVYARNSEQAMKKVQRIFRQNKVVYDQKIDLFRN